MLILMKLKKGQKCGNNWLTDKETEAENASEHPVQVPDGALDVNVQFEADVEKQNVDEHNIDDNNDDGLSDNGRIVNFASADSDDSKEDEFVENTQFDQQSAQGSSHKVTYSLDQSTPQRIQQDMHIYIFNTHYFVYMNAFISLIHSKQHASLFFK